MATKGSFTVSDSSEIIVPANNHRGEVTLQLASGSDDIFIGFGEDAVVDEGLKLSSSLPVYAVTKEHLARKAIYAICDTGESATGTYQEG